MKTDRLKLKVLWFALLVFMTISYPLACRASANNLTIVKLVNYTTIHELHTKPAGEVKGVPGATYKVWKLTEAEETMEYSALLRKLSGSSTDKLDADYPTHFISEKTDEDGKTTLSGLEDGRYYVVEVKETEQGWVRNSHGTPLVVDLPYYDGKQLLTDVTIYPKSTEPDVPEEPEEPTTVVILNKYKNVAELGNALPGVEFELYRKNPNGTEEKIYVLNGKVSTPQEGSSTLITDANGKISIEGLPLGEYYFKETKPLEGYKPLDRVIEFTVGGPGTVSLDVINEEEPPGGERFIKVSDGSEKPLPGAKFKVTVKEVDANGKTIYRDVLKNGQVYVVTSDAQGRFEFTGLPFGEYYLVETQSPTVDGVKYTLLAEPIRFVISENSYDDAVILKIVNKPTTPPDTPPVKPPDTPDTPGKPTKPEVVIPKTGDIQIFLYMIVGIFLVIGGASIYRSDRKST